MSEGPYRMLDMSEAQARDLLDPYTGLFVTCIGAAWRKWKDVDAFSRHVLDARARANVMYRFICEEVELHFAHVRGVNVMTVEGMLVLNVGGEAAIRFKKIGDDYRSSNIKTRHQELYSLQVELPNLPPMAARLTVGYQLEELQTEIKDIQVTHPKGDDLLWHYTLLEPAQSDTLPFPEIPLQPVQPTTPPRVRAKQVKKPSGE